MSEKSFSHEKFQLETLAIHAGQHPADPVYGSVAPPIYQTSTFAFPSPEEGAQRFAGQSEGYIYTRLGNPTVSMLEENVAALEGAKVRGIATASGMAAVTACYLALLSAGDHLVATAAMYGPSRVVVEQDLSRFGITASFIDTGDLHELEAAWRPNTKLLYIETPANPTIRLSDIAACAAFAHKRGVPLVVDNTFCSPILQNPLLLGADIVLHSMTKFINGHTDVVGGMLIPSNAELRKKLYHVVTYFGGCIDPHPAWLVLRGIKTLPMRVRTAQSNAQEIVRVLSQHPQIEWVNYPGLPDFPQKELAERQMKGPGSLIAFSLKGGFEAGKKMLQHVTLMNLAVSLGGIDTLIQHPASMTHACMAAEARLQSGITDGLVRLSAGCEHIDDLIADLSCALKHL
jgi:methionine-gamma-lyase